MTEDKKAGTIVVEVPEGATRELMGTAELRVRERQHARRTGNRHVSSVQVLL